MLRYVDCTICHDDIQLHQDHHQVVEDVDEDDKENFSHNYSDSRRDGSSGDLYKYVHTSKVITKKNRPSVYVPYMICIYEIYTYIFL